SSLVQLGRLCHPAAPRLSGEPPRASGRIQEADHVPARRRSSDVRLLLAIAPPELQSGRCRAPGLLTISSDARSKPAPRHAVAGGSSLPSSSVVAPGTID